VLKIKELFGVLIIFYLYFSNKGITHGILY
jgi:hypothetical protein